MAMWLMQNYITSRTSYRLVSGKGSRPTRTKLSTAGNFPFDHYKELLTTPKSISSIWKRLFQENAGGCQPASRNAAQYRAGHWHYAVLEYNLKVIPLYHTIGIMVVAYIVLYLPYTVQYITSAFTQINGSLLEAGRTFGGSPAYVFRRITRPMISRGIFAGWMMIFIIAFRELVTASLIAPPNTLVVSTYINREFEQGSVSLGGMAVMTGTLEKGSYSESLFRQGKMELLRYPVHLNHVQFEQLKEKNSFTQTIPYHSKEFSARREILF